MSSRRVMFVLTAIYAVGVILGGLCVLNVFRLAEKHIDRGEPLTQWSIVQISVGHFFVRNGYFVLALSWIILIGLWVAVLVRDASRTRLPDGGSE